MQDSNTPMSEVPVAPSQPVINEQPTYNAPGLSQPPKKSRKRLYIILGVILSLIIAGATVAYLVSRQQTQTEDKPALTNLTELNDSLRAAFQAEDGDVSILISETGNALAVVHKLGDRTWVPVDNDSKVLSLRASREKADQNKVDYDTFIAQMTEGGLTEILPIDTSGSIYDADGTTVQYFASEFIVCNLVNTLETALDVDAEAVPSFALDVKCAEKAGFSKNIEAAKPLTEAYISSELADETDMLFRAVTVQASGVEGFRNAEIHLAELSNVYSVSFGKFYQTKDNNWHLLAIVEDSKAVPCTDFDTLDKQSAFIGTPCWDETASATAFVNVPQKPGYREGDTVEP